MIRLAPMLKEDRTNTVDKGCLMAMVPEEQRKKLELFGKKLVSDEDLYIEGSEYGREVESHVTILYGFLPDLTEEQIHNIIDGVKPFRVRLIAISKFSNPKFDVVKFTVDSPILQQLNAKATKYPNQNDFPNYNAHMTIAYVKPGTFKSTRDGLNITVPISQICYSGANKKKLYFDL